VSRSATDRPLRFTVAHRSAVCNARLGCVETLHGSFDTPAFMPVGTRGSIKGIAPHMVAGIGAQIVLNNTYHLLLRPGPELVARMGGVHRFMNWDGPILTDSGGYQAFSMAESNTLDDDGVTFKSIVDGSKIRMTPERAIGVQNLLGADIIMAFDDCPPSQRAGLAVEGIGPAIDPRLTSAVKRDSGKKGYDHAARLEIALERTRKWLERCQAAHERPHEQSLFGIVQGGTDLAMRTRSASDITGVDLPGYAIGGVAVGESTDDIARVVAHTAPMLPADKPRYLMGVGYERDLLVAVRAGVDMFDCVLPTRNGRNANAFTSGGQIRLRNKQFAEDAGPIEEGCDCPVCSPGTNGWRTPGGRAFSRGYLRHLFQAEEMLGPILVSLHNLRHFQRFMADVRRTVCSGDWDGLLARWPVAAPVVAAAVAAGEPESGDAALLGGETVGDLPDLSA